jgi:ABC-type transporter Mla MlaB component
MKSTTAQTAGQWQMIDTCLKLTDKWQAFQVASVWHQIKQWQHIQSVDLSDVTLIDSALVALLVKIQTQIEHPLKLSGVSPFVRDLLGLYELETQFAEVLS